MVNSIHQMDAERQRARPSTTRRARPVAPVDRFSAHAGAPRRPGARALQTRSRLLDATVGLLDELPYRELTSAVVTQRLGLSAPAFYRYFADINDALAECASTMRDNVRAIADLVAGQTHAMFDNTTSALPQVRAGKLRALAVAESRRLRAEPGIPTVAESGVPGFEATPWFGVVVKAGAPQASIDALSSAIARIVKQPQVEARFAPLGVELIGSTPAEFSRHIEAELKKWEDVVRRSGAKLD